MAHTHSSVVSTKARNFDSLSRIARSAARRSVMSIMKPWACALPSPSSTITTSSWTQTTLPSFATRRYSATNGFACW